jgi:protein involved in polysaccharide export with SLBB domain
VVFVPPVDFQVTVKNEVRRPGIYEMRAGESLSDLLRFAGGVQPEAHIQRIEVDRILPPAQREPGRDRILLDADLLTLEDESGRPFLLEPGDEVTVHGVLAREEGRVTLQGDVWRPGQYEFYPGMTVWDLINQADGLSPSAFTPIAHIRRLILETGATRLLRASLETDALGQPLEDQPLEDLDVVVVFSRDSLRTADSVQIFGLVKEPGSYLLDEDATVEDLILKAGGYTSGAQFFDAELIRVEPGFTWSERIGTRYQLHLDGVIPHALADQAAAAARDPDANQPLASEFRLEADDQLFVRRRPGYNPPAWASVSGEVLFPGSYGFELRRERLSILVDRAGGLTADAYLPGARLVRGSIPVGIEIESALSRPGGRDDVLLEPGDQLIVPRYDPTVLVSGAVAFESRVLYGDGGGLSDFLSGAGGTLREADLDRVSIEYPNGERAVTRKFLFLFRNHPDVRPGSTIFVPLKAEGGGTDWNQITSTFVGMATTVLTLLVLADQLK